MELCLTEPVQSSRRPFLPPYHAPVCVQDESLCADGEEQPGKSGEGWPVQTVGNEFRRLGSEFRQ